MAAMHHRMAGTDDATAGGLRGDVVLTASWPQACPPYPPRQSCPYGICRYHQCILSASTVDWVICTPQPVQPKGNTFTVSRTKMPKPVMPSNASQSNYQGLAIAVRPTPEPNTYEFVVENQGNSTLWHIKFSTYELLGPHHFCLDDTHMPESLTREAMAEIICLEPGASVTITRQKWGSLERYCGPVSGSLLATFCPHPNEESRMGLRATYVIHVAAPRKEISPWATRSPRAFLLGRFLRNLIGRRHGNGD